MPWNALSPDGTISVKANRTKMNENTDYIQTTMGNTAVGSNTNATKDHFWNIGSNEDGRHRFINSLGFTVGGVAADPVIGSGMDGVLYLKQASAAVGRIEGFYKNAQGTYQYIPSVQTGTVVIGSAFVNIGSALPTSVYGEIFMYNNTNKLIQQGSFYTNATNAYCFSNRQKYKTNGVDYAVEFANSTDSVSLFLRAKRGDFGSGADGTYNFIITYRAL